MQITNMSPAIASRFQLGRTVATPGALRLLERAGIPYIALIRRHVTGDWGDVSGEDAQLNDFAAAGGGSRILSSYPVGNGRVWVITEADRSATTLLLPEEY